jgi:diguanylate cyclase (GGDEF)-like protein
VASALQAVLPEEQGLLARYGGEEFAAVLTATDAAVAVKVAERMRQAVRALEIENAAASLNVVSVSIGAATATRGYGGSFEKLAETADRALYRAKKAGRDRVEFLMADEAEAS